MVENKDEGGRMKDEKEVAVGVEMGGVPAWRLTILAVLPFEYPFIYLCFQLEIGSDIYVPIDR